MEGTFDIVIPNGLLCSCTVSFCEAAANLPCWRLPCIMIKGWTWLKDVEGMSFQHSITPNTRTLSTNLAPMSSTHFATMCSMGLGGARKSSGHFSTKIRPSGTACTMYPSGPAWAHLKLSVGSGACFSWKCATGKTAGPDVHTYLGQDSGRSSQIWKFWKYTSDNKLLIQETHVACVLTSTFVCKISTPPLRGPPQFPRFKASS